MAPGIIHKKSRRDDVFTAVADAIVEAGVRAIRQRGRFTFALAGGSTPRGLYEILANACQDRLDWSSTFFFWGDERLVPKEHQESNFRMADESLLQPLKIADSQVIRIATELMSADQVAESYEQRLAEFFSVSRVGPPPGLDFVLLGMGSDGHTLSLFPDTTALQEQTRWVVSNKVPQLSTVRITMTAALVNQADHVAFMVIGPDKASRLAEVIDGPHRPMVLPSQLIQPTGSLHWFVDEAAAAELAGS